MKTSEKPQVVAGWPFTRLGANEFGISEQSLFTGREEKKK